jgi:hypothetical protein
MTISMPPIITLTLPINGSLNANYWNATAVIYPSQMSNISTLPTDIGHNGIDKRLPNVLQ